MNAWVITFNRGLKVKNWLRHRMVGGDHLTSPDAWPTSVMLRGHFGFWSQFTLAWPIQCFLIHSDESCNPFGSLDCPEV